MRRFNLSNEHLREWSDLDWGATASRGDVPIEHEDFWLHKGG